MKENKNIKVYYKVKIGKNYIEKVEIEYQPTEDEINVGSSGKSFLKELKLTRHKSQANMWEHLDEDFYYTHSARNVHEVIDSLENSGIPYNLLKLTEETTIEEETQLKDKKESTNEDNTKEPEKDVANDLLVDILWDAKQTSDLIKSISKAFEKLSK